MISGQVGPMASTIENKKVKCSKILQISNLNTNQNDQRSLHSTKWRHCKQSEYWTQKTYRIQKLNINFHFKSNKLPNIAEITACWYGCRRAEWSSVESKGGREQNPLPSSELKDAIPIHFKEI